jgi:hypothetical protein
MRKPFAFIALLILTGGIFFNSCVKKVPEKIVWSESFDQGFSLAQDQDRNLLVDFDMQG